MTRVSGRQEVSILSPASKSSASSSSGQTLIELAIVGDLRGMRKRLRNSIFKRADDLNLLDANQCSALHHAVKHGHQHVVNFLVSRGADVKGLDNRGWGLVHFAVRFSSSAMLELILSFSEVEVDVMEQRGWTPLHMAARNGQASRARILLEHGANVALRQKQGWNALHLAVRYGQPDTISTLLEYGIDINAENKGWTALHLAALNGHTDIASILLNKDADTNKCNNDAHTPLDIARREKHERIVAMILEQEFRSTLNLHLPSPPPTPLRDTRPSAPPLADEADQQNNEDPEHLVTEAMTEDNFDQWCRNLEKRVTAMTSDPYDEQEEAEDSNMTEDTKEEEAEEDSYASPLDDLGSTQFVWKSLEEEARLLSNQLRRLRRQEVATIKNDIRRIKQSHHKRQANIELGQQGLREELLRLDSTSSSQICREQQEREKEVELLGHEINALIDAWREQGQLIGQLASTHVVTTHSRSSQTKRNLIEELQRVHHSEKMELDAALDDLAARRQRLQTAVQEKREFIERQRETLETHLTTLDTEKVRIELELETRLGSSLEQLERAERKKHLFEAEINAEQQDQNWFGCPICLEVLKPPTKIFQCPEGHILCEECKENPALVHCPQCRCSLEGQCSRNRALEEVARSYFPLAPSETL